jgi:GDP-mannose 6-dehydrogenase
MRISVFGLGYVGCVTAACLAQKGHDVIGVDVNEAKVRAIQKGISPLIEPGLDELIREGRASNRLRATQDAVQAVAVTDVSLVCVGTPSLPNGGLDPQYVLRVCEQIGQALAGKTVYHVVVLRSTVLPGILQTCMYMLSRSSRKAVGEKLGFVANPEFLREGSSVRDFFHPPLTLIGQADQRAGDRVAQMYAGFPGSIVRTDPGSAMMVKYASNAFHALKITFANEIGNLCKTLGLDGREVMEIFCQDTILNISGRYLKPGFAFGGSCLPKDLRAILHLARHEDLTLPVLESILPSNEAQLQAALDLIVNGHQRKVGLIGLSFKPNTDDLRESPMVQLAETLLGKGYQLKIYDQNVNPNSLMGGNRLYIEAVIPHLSALMCETVDEVIAASEVVVVAHEQQGRVAEAVSQLTPDQTLIDLARIVPDGQRPANYEGICW